MAEQVWSEVEVQKAITDEKTARLKTQRLARDVEEAAAAKNSKPTTE
ncbi:hypothetical protein [Methylobacterium sp. J-090]|nr:hypothetical protein [Methylobacterium sp. J-090]MCJ2082755.1 hypothetical protein [Methylobacterium sp. J-090]